MVVAARSTGALQLRSNGCFVFVIKSILKDEAEGASLVD
jgi:hypothetical protein